jgi:hypothetical protein
MKLYLKGETMKTGLVKNVIRLVTSASVGAVVGNIIRATTPPGLSVLSKGLVAMGEIILSGLVANEACDYVIDKLENKVPTLVESQPETL